MKFRESATAHKYLDRLKGIEVGAAAHNPFGLDTINVDNIVQTIDTIYGMEQHKLCGEVAKVDIVADMNKIPVADKSYDFVISSHVLEHSYSPIHTLREWSRVAKKYVVVIIPHKDRTFDKDNELTHHSDIGVRCDSYGYNLCKDKDEVYEDKHWNIWNTETFIEFINEYSTILNMKILEVLDVDDKVGNGFMVVLKAN